MPKTKATFIDPMLLPGGRNSRKVRIGRMRLSWTGTCLGHQERRQSATAIAQR